MVVIVQVTGGRFYADRQAVRAALLEVRGFYELTCPGEHTFILRHGAASGADTLCAQEAESLGWAVQAYRAEWERYRDQRKNPAGVIRNEFMAALKPKADLCIAFPGNSGTADMIEACNRHKIYVIRRPH